MIWPIMSSDVSQTEYFCGVNVEGRANPSSRWKEPSVKSSRAFLHRFKAGASFSTSEGEHRLLPTAADMQLLMHYQKWSNLLILFKWTLLTPLLTLKKRPLELICPQTMSY